MGSNRAKSLKRPTAVDPKVQLATRISRVLHRRLKLHAVEHGLAIEALVTTAIEAVLRRGGGSSSKPPKRRPAKKRSAAATPDTTSAS